jgi:hypothetical protein
LVTPRRQQLKVRAPRAYLAGFGTSGSLLAGASLLFVLASAIVAFRGWPAAGPPAATGAVAVAQPGAPSIEARRLNVAIVAVRASVRAPARTGLRFAGRRGGSDRRISSGQRPTAAAGGRPAQPTTAGGGSPPASGPTSALLGGCSGSGCAAAAQGTASNATTTAAQTISGAGNSIGSQVSGIAGKVGVTNAPGGSVVQNAGTTAGNVVSQTATTAGGVVSGVGNSLPGG